MPARIITCDADKDPREALSPTLARILVEQSPAHVRQHLDHPPDPTAAMELGSAIHARLLGKGRPIYVVQAPDWRTKAAKEARELAREKGMTPMLEADYEALATTTQAIQGRLGEAGILLDGDSEVKIEWESRGVLCRGVLDHIRGCVIYDVKTTKDASARSLGRTVYAHGYDIQAAAYTEALEELRPELEGKIRFVLLFCEVDAPHAVQVVELDSMFRELGKYRWERAKQAWMKASTENDWKAFGPQPVYLEPPRYALYEEGFAP